MEFFEQGQSTLDSIRDAAVSAVPKDPFFGEQDPRKRVALLQLSQLAAHGIPTPPDRPMTSAFSCDIALDLMKKWSRDNKDVIERAKSQRVYGSNGKEQVDWNNTFLAFMESAGMYLRDFSVLASAVRKFQEFLKHISLGTMMHDLMQQAIDLWEGSQTSIRKLAHEWGMDFLQICDLSSTMAVGHAEWDGPYCGAYYSIDKNNPFIGIAFKGTNPMNLRDVKVDYDYDYVTPEAKLFTQQVSKGVYGSLFGRFPNSPDSPLANIATVIDRDVAPLCSKTDKIRTHVTGHSLGGSYATFSYVQYLIDSGVTPSKIQLGDLYTFGSPRVGHKLFADAIFAKMASHDGAIWRIFYHDDLVPQVPPASFKNLKGFRHTDGGIAIDRNGPPKAVPHERLGDEVASKDIPSDPVALLRLIRDTCHHLPTAYYDGIRKALGL